LLDIYWNILTMHGPMNVKSPNNTSKWEMGFNSAFKGLILLLLVTHLELHPVKPQAINIPASLF